jgi:hypothetical protein
MVGDDLEGANHRWPERAIIKTVVKEIRLKSVSWIQLAQDSPVASSIIFSNGISASCKAVDGHEKLSSCWFLKKWSWLAAYLTLLR